MAFLSTLIGITLFCVQWKNRWLLAPRSKNQMAICIFRRTFSLYRRQLEVVSMRSPAYLWLVVYHSVKNHGGHFKSLCKQSDAMRTCSFILLEKSAKKFKKVWNYESSVENILLERRIPIAWHRTSFWGISIRQIIFGQIKSVVLIEITANTKI